MPNTVPVDTRNRKYCAVTWGTVRLIFPAAIVKRDPPRPVAGMQEADPEIRFLLDSRRGGE
jgi:hypothetical protein